MPLRIVTDLSAGIIDRLPAAVDAGLVAAAEVYQEEVQRALHDGYTSGAFVTGAAEASVEVRGPAEGQNGRAVSVGTDLLYPLFWEIGHHNLFTRQYERVEIWRPALESKQDEMRDAFNGAALSVLLQGVE